MHFYNVILLQSILRNFQLHDIYTAPLHASVYEVHPLKGSLTLPDWAPRRGKGALQFDPYETCLAELGPANKMGLVS